MNREEFMRRLGQLLSDISEEERQDALDFYRSYFEDAGEGNEASILRELGSPEKVAEDIKRNLGAVEVVKTKEDTGAGSRKEHRSEEADSAEQFYGKNPYGSGSYGKTGNSSNGASYAGGSYGSMSGQEAMNQFRQEKKKNTVLWVILVILTSPIWLTLLIVIASLLLGVLACIFAIAVCVVVMMAACLFAGFLIAGAGIGYMISTNVAVGLGVLGGGLLVIALGILAVWLVVWCFGWFVPWAVKGIVKGCKSLFHRGKEHTAA